MRFTAAFLDELRARTSLSAVVGRRLRLQRAGREWKACCPFHDEKTASFYVNDDKAFYHCFGCGAHGDVIRYLTDAQGMTFVEAVSQLAREAGLDLPAETEESRARDRQAAAARDITAQAAAWFADELRSPAGAAARAYLQRRGVSMESAARFGLGFAPDGGRALVAALGQHPAEALVGAGLAILSDRGGDEGRVYDRFRNRLIFPIRDRGGRVVGFGGRTLGDDQPKYLNSPDTPLFDKGRLLYNLDAAAQPARRAGRLFLVEGYMDVIGLADAGIGEAVASLGTSLTDEQLALAWRIAPEPLLCFDGDAAGKRAAFRAAARALPHLEPGRSLGFVLLPGGQDPDDLVRSQGRDAFERLAAGAETLVDFLWRTETEADDASTPERQAALEERLRGHARAIGNSTIARLYRAEFARRMAARFDQPWIARGISRGMSQGIPRGISWARSGSGNAWGEGRGAGQQRGQPGGKLRGQARGEARIEAGPRVASVSRALKLQASLPAPDAEAVAVLDALLGRPELVDQEVESLADLPVASQRLGALRDAILAAAADGPCDPAALGLALAARGVGDVAEEVRRRNRLRFSFNRSDAPLDLARRDLASVVDTLISRHHIRAELEQLRPRYAALDETGFEMQKRLKAELSVIEGEVARLAERGHGDPTSG